MRVDQAHPWLGGGVLLTLTLPIQPEGETAGALCVALNGLEQARLTRAHGFGSWCLRPNPPYLAFTSFLPNLGYRPGVLLQMVLAMAMRAVWASDVFAAPPAELGAYQWHAVTSAH